MGKIAVVFGTRPEIIKLAELIKLLKKESPAKVLLVFSGQHYDYNLNQVFLRELQLPAIDLNLGVSGGTNASQVSRMFDKLLSFLEKQKVETVVAQGDTNTVLAAALASFYSNCRFAHVEAGLRSRDWRMPEEFNRVVADAIACYAFAPTVNAARNLKKEGKQKESIYLTGNTIVEAVQRNLAKAGKRKILQKLGLQNERYAVLTAHRQEYVDKKKNLLELLKAIGEIKIEIVFPAHPRTIKNLQKFGLMERATALKNLRFIEPIGYFDFLQLASNSMFLLSDSGGIQEEASVYKKYVVVLRDNTERPEIIGKFGCLTGYDREKIVKAGNAVIKNHAKIKKRLLKLQCPFGDGKASKRIAKILLEEK